MALAMRDGAAELSSAWRQRGHDLHVGIGIAQGKATIGAIGFEGRWDYGAIGSVTNLAFRLCGEAQAGQILTTARVLATIDGLVAAESLGELPLKGFSRPVPTFNAVFSSGPRRQPFCRHDGEPRGTSARHGAHLVAREAGGSFPAQAGSQPSPRWSHTGRMTSAPTARGNAEAAWLLPAFTAPAVATSLCTVLVPHWIQARRWS